MRDATVSATISTERGLDRMRLFVHNPHNFNLVGTPVSYWLIGKKPMPKYWYLLDRACIADADILFFADATTSSLMPDQRFNRLPFVVRLVATWLETILWAWVNKVPVSRLRFRGTRVRPDDVLVSFTYRDFRGDFAGRAKILERFGAVLAHLSHYCIDLATISRNAETVKHKVWFIGEAPLHETCDIFRRGFPWYDRPVLVAPFAPQPRFDVRRPMAGRDLRAVSTGSFHILSQEPEPELWAAFRTLSGLDTVHPLRQALFERKAEAAPEVDVRNALFWERKPATGRAPSGVLAVIKHAIRTFKAKAAPQSAYLSLDIVDLYNSYAFSVIGEEATGLPGVGLAESMACGCVYIGQKDAMYDALGMVDGEHYLTHDGTVEGLRRVVAQARLQPERIAAISAAGVQLVAQRWNKTVVVRALRDLAQRALAS